MLVELALASSAPDSPGCALDTLSQLCAEVGMSDTGGGDSEADVVRNLEAVTGMHTSAYVSIRQHTSAYVSIRQHTSAYVSRRGGHSYADVCT